MTNIFYTKPFLYIFLQYICLIPFIACLSYMEKINMDRGRRYKQMAMPAFALLYCVMVFSFHKEIIGLFNTLVSIISNIIYYLLNLLESRFHNIQGFTSFLRDIMSVLSIAYRGTVTYKFIMFTIFNPVILWIYCRIKKHILKVLNRKITGEEGSLYTKLNIFYKYDTENCRWYIAKNYGQASELMKRADNIIMNLALLFSVYTFVLVIRGDISELFYPVYVILLIREIYFFFDGYIKGETDDLEGEADQARWVSNYIVLRKILRHLFGDKLISEDTSVDVIKDEVQTNDEVLSELEKSADPKLEAYGIFMRRRVSAGLALEQSYLASGKELLEGKSIVFNNPFYYDLIPYIFYPINRKLMHHKKIMIILGRHDIEEDTLKWCQEGLTQITNLPDLWRIGILSNEEQDLDVGIVTRSCVHDLQMQEKNHSFFENVGFVVLLEASKLLATAQIGLNSLVRYCCNSQNDVVYCSIDKNCDGLVDALSHILLTDLTEVSASNHQEGISSYMCWTVDEECMQHRMLSNISRYLGMGTELGMVALKNQIPEVSWYGGSAFPVIDMHWIAKQYYYDLFKYAELPAAQELMDKVFEAKSNFWNVRIKPHQYLMVEDEAYNMFEMKRCFSSRASGQGFINILSTEYLLKDYMADNNELFQSDSKAIPYIAADYAHTQRNVVFRLCLQMSSKLVSEQEIRNELKLVSVNVKNIVGDFWHLVCEYGRKFGEEKADEKNREFIRLKNDFGENVFYSDVICVKRKFSMEHMRMENFYYIENDDFIHFLLDDLQSAEYIAEDEFGNHNYLGTELKGQIFQRHLPGQFFTFSGKYYEVVRQTPDGKLIVRRAADHINGRKVYRQNRYYTISAISDSDLMGDSIKYSGIKVQTKYADIKVNTPSYWSMDKYNDFVNGRKVELKGVPERFYCNKQILCIDFSEFDEDLDKSAICTITMLLNEIFRSIFAENQEFIVAVTPCNETVQNTYHISSDEQDKIKDECIYIIEDSQMDIGLLIAVKRNLHRIFEIMYDYLNWHEQAVLDSMYPKPEPDRPSYVLPPDEQLLQPPVNVRKRILYKLRQMLKKSSAAIKRFLRKVKNKILLFFIALWMQLKVLITKIKKNKVNQIVNRDETVEAEETGTDTSEEGLEETEEIEFESDGAYIPSKRNEQKPYHLRHYLLFGDLTEPEWLDISGVKKVLSLLGCDGNELEQARKGKDLAQEIERDGIGEEGSHYCDFCGRKLSGTLYEVLADGRERCPACSKTTIRTEKEFINLYHQVQQNFKIFYGININVPIQIKMVNAKRLQKLLGNSFVPTGGWDSRTLGVAIYKKGRYYIFMENGSPKLQAALTLVHELTHIWQYLNWDAEEIRRKYGVDLELQVYEGMAEWNRIQYAYLLNESEAARREEWQLRSRNDEYGAGFIKYTEVYPISESTTLSGDTPFEHPHEPL